jgi:hypothetical protein
MQRCAPPIWRRMCAGTPPTENIDVVIRATIQVCHGFRLNRRISFYEVEEAPPQVWKFITGASFTPEEAQEILEELIQYGYRITIHTKEKPVSVLDAANW